MVSSSYALLGGFAIGARQQRYDNTAPNAKCQRVLVLALCLVILIIIIQFHERGLKPSHSVSHTDIVKADISLKILTDFEVTLKAVQGHRQ